MIPAEADAAFAVGTGRVLDTYALPRDPAVPVLCIGEQPVQLFKETRTPVLATAGRPERVDCQCDRAGTTDTFTFTEPPAGWREATVRTTKTRVGWGVEVGRRLAGRYAGSGATTLPWCATT